MKYIVFTFFYFAFILGAFSQKNPPYFEPLLIITDSSECTVHWVPKEKVSSYAIKVEDVLLDSTYIFTVGSTTKHTFTKLIPGNQYSLLIAPYNSEELDSVKFNVWSFGIISSRFPSPSELTVSGNQDNVIGSSVFTWLAPDFSAESFEYTIQLIDNNENAQEAFTDKTSMSLDDMNLHIREFTDYRCVVTANNGITNSRPSDTLYITTGEYSTYLSPPKFISTCDTAIKDTLYRVSWNPIENADFYEITAYSGGIYQQEHSKHLVNDTLIIIDNMEKYTGYYINCRAGKIIDEDTLYSDYSTCSIMRPYPAPIPRYPECGSTGVTEENNLEWEGGAPMQNQSTSICFYAESNLDSCVFSEVIPYNQSAYPLQRFENMQPNTVYFWTVGNGYWENYIHSFTSEPCKFTTGTLSSVEEKNIGNIEIREDFNAVYLISSETIEWVSVIDITGRELAVYNTNIIPKDILSNGLYYLVINNSRIIKYFSN